MRTNNNGIWRYHDKEFKHSPTSDNELVWKYNNSYQIRYENTRWHYDIIINGSIIEDYALTQIQYDPDAHKIVFNDGSTAIFEYNHNIQVKNGYWKIQDQVYIEHILSVYNENYSFKQWKETDSASNKYTITFYKNTSKWFVQCPMNKSFSYIADANTSYLSYNFPDYKKDDYTAIFTWSNSQL